MATLVEAPEHNGAVETGVGIAATVSSSAAVLSCSACCVLPLALPAAALAGAGATLTWFESAAPWLRGLSVVILAGAWFMVWHQTSKTGRSAARSTVILLGVSTMLTVIALLWEPLIEAPFVGLLR